MRRLVLMALLLSGCASAPEGVSCPGEVASIYGKPLGQTRGHIFDLVHSFSVSNEDVKVESGALQSLDRFKYVPSAVTQEGYYAQRLSSQQFRLINPYQNVMITWTCP